MSTVSLVTGGSGAVGKAIVRKLRADGHEVVFTWHRDQAAAEALRAETGALAVQADLTQADQVRDAVSRTVDRFGPPDVLVNNAGVTQVMPFALIEEEDWDMVLAANLKSMFLVTREVVRHMVARKRGIIINIGSIAGHRLLEVPVHYATAKAGVSGFTISLAKELARYNIRVNSVVPGMLEEGVGTMVPEKEKAEYLRYCAAGRPGRTTEVAEVVGFLASDKASYLNAQNFCVDGGI